MTGHLGIVSGARKVRVAGVESLPWWVGPVYTSMGAGSGAGVPTPVLQKCRGCRAPSSVPRRARPRDRRGRRSSRTRPGGGPPGGGGGKWGSHARTGGRNTQRRCAAHGSSAFSRGRQRPRAEVAGAERPLPVHRQTKVPVKAHRAGPRSPFHPGPLPSAGRQEPAAELSSARPTQGRPSVRVSRAPHHRSASEAARLVHRTTRASKTLRWQAFVGPTLTV
jgi:hypothetical protein